MKTVIRRNRCSEKEFRSRHSIRPNQTTSAASIQLCPQISVPKASGLNMEGNARWSAQMFACSTSAPAACTSQLQDLYCGRNSHHIPPKKIFLWPPVGVFSFFFLKDPTRPSLLASHPSTAQLSGRAKENDNFALWKVNYSQIINFFPLSFDPLDVSWQRTFLFHQTSSQSYYWCVD